MFNDDTDLFLSLFLSNAIQHFFAVISNNMIRERECFF